jgi:hypothetical protein
MIAQAVALVAVAAAVTALVSTIIATLRTRQLSSPLKRTYVVSATGKRSLRIEARGIDTSLELRQLLVEALSKLAGKGEQESQDDSDDEESDFYPRVLAQVADRAYRPVVEEIYVRYEVGTSADEDTVEETFLMRAGDPNRPLLWREVGTATLGPEAPELRSFEDLRDIRVVERTNGTTKELKWVPIVQSEERVGALVLFEPEITARAPRRWTLSYRLPGLWDPLRLHLTDKAFYRISRNTSVTKLRLVFVFPKTAVAPRVLDLGKNPIQPQYSSEEDGRTAAVFDFDRPSPGNYRWELKVEHFQ